MITIEQLKDIKERTEALNRYLDIEGKKIQVEEEQLRTQACSNGFPATMKSRLWRMSCSLHSISTRMNW